ncbi:hypothetical protein vseg_000914 [Gypsophila vaccaria]
MDKIGFWNVGGMNRSRKRKEINFFLKNKGVGLFGLLETKIKNKGLPKAMNSFDDWSISTNNGFCNGGRIWIVWQPAVFRVHFMEYNSQFINKRVESLLSRNWFYITMVYAFNEYQERMPLWNSLRRIAQQTQGPWAVAGDFNCVLSPSERVGGNVASAEIEPFMSCVEDCEIIDIASVGSVFTWNNKQKPENRIYSRIDRFMINKNWYNVMPESYAHFMPEGLCDHTPCIVNQSPDVQRKTSFKYYNMWGASDKFLPLLQHNWNHNITGTPMFQLIRNLKNLKIILRGLNKEQYNDIEITTADLEKKVQCLQEQIGHNPMNTQLIEEEYNLLQELADKTEARDAFLAQKSKQQWALEGDRNSAYFHGIIKGRRTGNKVILIEDMNGEQRDTPEGIKGAFIDYYQSLIGSTQDTNRVHKKIIDQGPRCIEDMYSTLMAPVTGKEIKETLFNIPDIKSPGPYGYTSKFFKDGWTIIGGSVIKAVQDFFTHKKLLNQVNATNLVLLPKTERPKTVQQFRPIACCNVIYKVISKLLCTRLANILPSLIDLNQGAFVQGRHIQENILICQDLIRLYERPNSSPRCLFKIDLQKAYDTVSWKFVEQLLDHLSFPAEFKQMLMECITTPKFSLTLNGEMFGYFQGQRALKQGDPLSPLIFTLCMEYLTRTIKYAAMRYPFHYHPMCKELKLANLMFADDVLLFCKGDVQSIMTLLRAYSTFF